MTEYRKETLSQQERKDPQNMNSCHLISCQRILSSQIQHFGSLDELVQKPLPDSQIQTHQKENQTDQNLWVNNLAHQHCLICLNSVQNPQMQAIPDCGHRFCKTCLNEHIKISMSSCKIAKCPLQGCNQTVTSSSPFLKYLTPQQQKKYAHIERYLQYINSQYTRMCPNQDCEGICDIKVNPTYCNICSESLCSICMNKFHEGNCDQNGIKYLSQNYYFRQCSLCKMMLQKSNGCPHMTCKCGHQFCYLCGSNWEAKHNCASMQTNNYIQDEFGYIQRGTYRLQEAYTLPRNRCSQIFNTTVRTARNLLCTLIVATIMILLLPFDLMTFTMIRTIRGSIQMVKTYTWYQILLGNIVLLTICIIQTTLKQFIQCQCQQFIKFFQPISYKVIKPLENILCQY